MHLVQQREDSKRKSYQACILEIEFCASADALPDQLALPS